MTVSVAHTCVFITQGHRATLFSFMFEASSRRIKHDELSNTGCSETQVLPISTHVGIKLSLTELIAFLLDEESNGA